MAPQEFILPDPDLQIAFSNWLQQARIEFLQDAVLKAVSESDIAKLDEEAHLYVPTAALQVVASRGLRAELVFAMPALLEQNPRLLAYYRLVLGFSQKSFYNKATGLSGYKRAEEGRGFTSAQKEELANLCSALNRCASLLVDAIHDDLTADHVEDLSLLTLGPQLRGGRNVAYGQAAIHQVFEVVKEIIGDRGESTGERLITFIDSTGRTVQVRFGSDPDIEAVSVDETSRAGTPLLAIEVKGGTDFSNVHNRLGEAEKSHLKAKNQRGFTDLWTVVNVQGLSEERRRRDSPTTTAFFDLVDIVARQGEAYASFRERFLQKLRLPSN